MYERIERSEDRSGILDLPLSPTNTALYLAYQTEHQLPIADGYLSRRSRGSLVERLKRVRPDRVQDLLIENAIRYVVLHRAVPDPGQGVERQRRFFEQAGLRVVFDDEEAILMKGVES